MIVFVFFVVKECYTAGLLDISGRLKIPCSLMIRCSIALMWLHTAEFNQMFKNVFIGSTSRDSILLQSGFCQ